MILVVLFLSNRVPVPLVALAVSLSLWATGILSLDQALAGFGDPTGLSITQLGLPLMGWYAVISIAVVPQIWRF